MQQDEYKRTTRYQSYDLLPLIRQHALALMSLHNQNCSYQIYWVIENEIKCLENSSRKKPFYLIQLLRSAQHARNTGGYWIESMSNEQRFLHSIFEDKNSEGCWFLSFVLYEAGETQPPMQINKTHLGLKDTLHQKLDIILEKINQENSIGHTRRNREIVRRSFAMGIFNMKGAVSLVSNRLNISQHTVYLYVRECKQVEASLAKALHERNY